MTPMPEPSTVALMDIHRRGGLLASMRTARRVGVYIDPVNRHRDEYLSGEIDVEEFERRVEATLRNQPRDMGNVEPY